MSLARVTRSAAKSPVKVAKSKLVCVFGIDTLSTIVAKPFLYLHVIIKSPETKHNKNEKHELNEYSKTYLSSGGRVKLIWSEGGRHEPL